MHSQTSRNKRQMLLGGVLFLCASCSGQQTTSATEVPQPPVSVDVTPDVGNVTPDINAPVEDITRLVVVEATNSMAFGPEVDVNGRGIQNFRTAVVAGSYNLAQATSVEAITDKLSFNKIQCETNWNATGPIDRGATGLWSPVLDVSKLETASWNANTSGLSIFNGDQLFSELVYVDSSDVLPYPHLR